MAVTFTPAAARDVRQTRARTWHFDPALVLAATSFTVAVAIGSAYAGRSRTLARSDHAAINVNNVESADLLEPNLTAAFPDAQDRRFAAGEWWAWLSKERANAPLPNVAAATTRVAVAAAAIDQNSRLDAFARRLAAAREAAAAAGRPAPATVPLFTSADLALIKPAFAVRSSAEFRNQVLLWSVLYVLAFHVVALAWRARRVDGDVLLLAAAHLLSGLGFAILLSRPDPLRDMPLFVRYSEGVIVGLGLAAALSLIDFRKAARLELSFVPLLAASVLCALLILFGSGPGRSGAKVNLGPVQPIEAIRLLLALFLAGYFARRWELLRGVRALAIRGVQVPRWMNLPRGEYILPVLAGVCAALVLFVLQRDLGPALLLCCVFLTMYVVARGAFAMAAAGVLLLVAGVYAGHLGHVSRTLSDRVLMWQSPWDNAVPGGDQVAQAIWAMAAGGVWGTGAGLGDTRYVSAGHTDLILASLAEELGVIGMLAVAAAYVVIAWRGLRIARSSASDYGFFLAAALTFFLIVPVLVMAAGTIGIVPLTGVVTPFLSYGGSAMAANFASLGVLSSIHSDRRPKADLRAFDVPLRIVAGGFAAAAAVLLAAFVNIQVVHADDYLVRAHLGVQADGGRRYAYNPRILDVARQIPRGTIFDRRGLPLATDDAEVLARAREAYSKLGIAIPEACPSPAARCYPLGARAFHLLGDVRNRVNWSAPNTSYIERDGETALRGFDDHATIVPTTDVSGRPMATIKRDYREIVPLLRHRRDPDHPAVAAFARRSRDIRSTVDAALQIRVSSIVEAYAKRASGKAAAIVLDADTGAILASATYPRPPVDGPNGTSALDEKSEGEVADALLDRARYGLYPPGSTFKLVTAAAALNRDLDLAHTVFTCTRLPDGRIGAKLPGWTHPVRDDVLDAHPHGDIDMHAAVVHSCNAYFAQLALKVGPQAMLDCASRLGIALTPSSAPAARVRDMLPQIGYGQADVLATPLRMARVAAAIADGGILHEARWDQSRAPVATPFLVPAAARLLAGYLRDTVTSGTGSSLRNHPGRIAGKTGTAEVAGAPSHAWFVGYAPFGPARKRIAFAIVVEHAGYGGRIAAPAAGEIVTAATLSALVE